jgi:hypothetical protein
MWGENGERLRTPFAVAAGAIATGIACQDHLFAPDILFYAFPHHFFALLLQLGVG